MLDKILIEKAVLIQQRSFKLFKWIGDAMEQGFISFTRAHGYASATESAYDWIVEHYENLPIETRPEKEWLREFCNFFGTYMTASFDLVEVPGKRLMSYDGCYCPLCTYLANASHLQAKKLTAHDKQRAIRKCAARLEMLAREEGFTMSQEQASAIAESKEHRKDAAYSAYGFSPIERMRGAELGPHVLALWRMIAWKPEGSPIKGFVLKAEDIMKAEERLVAVSKSRCS